MVFAAGLFARGEDRRFVGWLATFGVLALVVLSLFLSPVDTPAGALFVQDGLALFAKRLFLVATFIGLLAGLSLPGTPFARRSTEYHVLILTSLLGMLVLASARDMVLLFVAFELMSIPLYVLSGFVKRRRRGRGIRPQVLPRRQCVLRDHGLRPVVRVRGNRHDRSRRGRRGMGHRAIR